MQSGNVDQLCIRRVVDLLIRESGFRSEWFQVFGMGIFDDSDLSQVVLGQSQCFPAWRQRTRSAVLDVSEGVNRPGGPQTVTPVEKTPPSHREPSPTTIRPVYCRHAGKHPGQSETTLQKTSMKFICGATLLI